MLCLLPEQLISKGFADLLEYKPFWKRFCALGVDEIHLLYQWGMSFRLVYQQIEFIRSQCPPWIVTIGLSATVAKGRVMDHVCKFLGYRPGKFHVIQRSNARYDVLLEQDASKHRYWVIGSIEHMVFVSWVLVFQDMPLGLIDQLMLCGEVGVSGGEKKYSQCTQSCCVPNQ